MIQKTAVFLRIAKLGYLIARMHQELRFRHISGKPGHHLVPVLDADLFLLILILTNLRVGSHQESKPFLCIAFRHGVAIFRRPAARVISYFICISHARLKSGHSRFVYIISRHSPGRTAISRHHLKITILHRVPADLPGTAAGRHPVQTDLIVGSSHLQAQIFNWCAR